MSWLTLELPAENADVPHVEQSSHRVGFVSVVDQKDRRLGPQMSLSCLNAAGKCKALLCSARGTHEAAYDSVMGAQRSTDNLARLNAGYYSCHHTYHKERNGVVRSDTTERPACISRSCWMTSLA